MWRTLALATLIISLSTGLASADKKPMTGQEFVDRCESRQPSDIDKCWLFYVTALASLGIDKTCEPGNGPEPAGGARAEHEKQIHRVVAWIKLHPDSLSKWFVDSVADALDAEYPCVKP